MRNVFLLPGLGSQYYGMGRVLYETNEAFRANVDVYDKILFELAGRSFVSEVMLPVGRRSQPFADVVFGGACIFCCELAMIDTLAEASVWPDVILGSSLGVFAAVALSSGINVKVAIDLLLRQGQLFQDCCPPGAMATVLAPISVFERAVNLHKMAEVAAENFDGSFVLSFPEDHADEVKAWFRQQNLIHQILPVDRAYHSRWIDDAKLAFLDLYKGWQFSLSDRPVYCTSAVGELNEVTPEVLWAAARGCLRFADTINSLERRPGAHRYIDVGPSGTLATFLKYCPTKTAHSNIFPIITMHERCPQNMRSLIERVVM